MGMIANYQSTTDTELEKIMCLDDVEELQESEDIEICDIDKMWDALHFLLTGKSASEPIEDDLISEAIVGQFNISGEEIFISGTKTDRVKEIAKALQELDFETYIDKFDMSAFSQNDIYPNIWGYEDEADEIKDDLRKLYALNFPETPIYGDITKINPEDIPPHDIVCAGFPCQPFSQAGKREGFNDTKQRGTLFDYICAIVAEHRPKYLLLENVQNLKNHDNGNTWKVIQDRKSVV